MSWLGSLGSALTGGLSNLFDGSDSAGDFLDPLNLFHVGRGERTANEQWMYEYQLDKQNFEEQQKWNQKNFEEQQRVNDLNFMEQQRMNSENIRMQQQAYDYQVALNRLQMEREDMATQRRVADLKAAGLSPTLAAGSAAETGALHAGSAPQGVAPQLGISQRGISQRQAASQIKAQAAMFKQQMMKDQLQLATTLMGNFADISRTKAETELIKAQSNQISSLTPVDLALKEQLLEFNESMNPHKIKQAVNDIDLQEKNKALKDFDLILAQDDHAMKAYQMAKINLENDLIRVNMSVADREYILKGLAINMAEMENANYAHAMDWFDERYSGAPVGFSIPSWSTAASNSVYNIATKAAQGLEDFVKRNFDQAKNAAAHARSLATNPDKHLHSFNKRSRYYKR